MKSLIKDIIPTPVLRRLRETLVTYNQWKIARACDKHSRIFIKPENRVEHYFHFLFDLALPLSRLIQTTPPNVVFVIKDFGIFTDRIVELFPDRVEISKDDQGGQGLKTLPLTGMNPQFVHLNFLHIRNFKNHVRDVFKLDVASDRNQVLLIERMPPNSYFVNDAVKKGAGASRRSIPNHRELADAISAIVQTPLEFFNLQLEELSFEEQIRHFDRAAVVIGQHGAGLANCIWMRPESNVVELSHNLSLKHFRVVSQVMRHNYILQETSGPHETIDVEELIGELMSKFERKEIFRIA